MGVTNIPQHVRVNTTEMSKRKTASLLDFGFKKLKGQFNSISYCMTVYK